MTETAPERGQWSSRLGFVLAAAGSAIGLGNIWLFPFMTGLNGGAAFVLIYLICVVLICLPYMFGELALGRFTQKNPVGAFRAIRPGSPWIGAGFLCVVAGISILSFYAVVAGWTLGYVFKLFMRDNTTFEAFVANPYLAIPLFLSFLIITILVVYGGIQKGIERWSKILLPVLVVLMILLIVRGLTLAGAEKGLRFYLKPDFSKINGRVILAAMGQAFFSLSLGIGGIATYGSYLSRKENLVTSGIYVALFDTAIALLAGLLIFPALFAFGEQPNAGPALVFIILPKIFQQLPLGNAIGAGFFVLLALGALTSTISMLEVPVSYLVDEKGWSRKITVWMVGSIIFIIGLPSALSNGAVPALSSISFLGGKSLLDVMIFIWFNLAPLIGAVLISLFVGWIWGSQNAAEEIASGAAYFEKSAKTWGLFIRFVIPVLIFIVLLSIINLF